MRQWIIKTNPTKYPDLFTYDILEKNPDAGKSGVPFSGEYFGVTMGLDSKEDAHLIAAAPDMYEALKIAQSEKGDWRAVIDMAIAKAEGK